MVHVRRRAAAFSVCSSHRVTAVQLANAIMMEVEGSDWLSSAEEEDDASDSPSV